MKQMQLTIMMVLVIGQGLFAQVVNPIQDYYNGIMENKRKGWLESDVSNIIYKWSADVAGGGKEVIFLIMKDFYKVEKHDDVLPSWAVYLTGEGQQGYLHNSEKESQIDEQQMYVGQITQLDQRGIVTIRIDRPRKDRNPPVAYIFAYTIDGDHFKRTLLAQYNPDEGANPIYNQYLTEEKRTHVTLQEVVP